MICTCLYLEFGDLCDDDVDGDGILNEDDNCPLLKNPDQEPGILNRGKACEMDFDGDGVKDSDDVCPENPTISTTNFGHLETMDLCKASNVTSNNLIQCYPIKILKITRGEWRKYLQKTRTLLGISRWRKRNFPG